MRWLDWPAAADAQPAAGGGGGGVGGGWRAKVLARSRVCRPHRAAAVGRPRGGGVATRAVAGGGCRRELPVGVPMGRGVVLPRRGGMTSAALGL